MMNEKNKTVDEYEDNSSDKCEEKNEKLKQKLQEIGNELEEISVLYAKAVKDGFDKATKK